MVGADGGDVGVSGVGVFDGRDLMLEDCSSVTAGKAMVPCQSVSGLVCDSISAACRQ